MHKVQNPIIFINIYNTLFTLIKQSKHESTFLHNSIRFQRIKSLNWDQISNEDLRTTHVATVIGRHALKLLPHRRGHL